MGNRRLRPMTAADLDLLPDPGARCVRAEGDAAEQAQEVTDRWGACGVLAVHEEQVVGFVAFAPGDLARQQPSLAAAPDVAALLTAYVVPEWRRKGLGRQLVSSAAGLLTRRDVRAFEALGTRQADAPGLLPVGWLEAVGFAVVREHPVTPRLRMDLQTAQRWPGLGAAWNRLTGLVVPPAAPQPASYARRDADPVPPQPAVQSG